MEKLKTLGPGVLLCLAIALPCWLLGKQFPIIGGPVFAILCGMVLTMIWREKDRTKAGIQYTSKKILQYAVILLGFGMNLSEIARVGAASLPTAGPGSRLRHPGDPGTVPAGAQPGSVGFPQADRAGQSQCHQDTGHGRPGDLLLLRICGPGGAGGRTASGDPGRRISRDPRFHVPVAEGQRILRVLPERV